MADDRFQCASNDGSCQTNAMSHELVQKKFFLHAVGSVAQIVEFKALSLSSSEKRGSNTTLSEQGMI